MSAWLHSCKTLLLAYRQAATFWLCPRGAERGREKVASPIRLGPTCYDPILPYLPPRSSVSIYNHFGVRVALGRTSFLALSSFQRILCPLAQGPFQSLRTSVQHLLSPLTSAPILTSSSTSDPSVSLYKDPCDSLGPVIEANLPSQDR